MRKYPFLAIIFSFVLAFGLIFVIWKNIVNFPDETVDYINIGGNYVFNEDVICKVDSNENLTLLIPDHIENYNYDEQYIVVKQIPTFNMAKYYWMNFSGHDKDSITELIVKSKMLDACYWIIRKKGCVVFGPMEKSDYIKEKKKLGIRLKLNDLY